MKDLEIHLEMQCEVKNATGKSSCANEQCVLWSLEYVGPIVDMESVKEVDIVLCAEVLLTYTDTVYVVS